MARRLNLRAIKSARSYKIDEVAELTGSSIPTVRGWIKSGLRAMTAQRPFLILGADLREFHEARRKRRSGSLAIGEFYCLSCKAARRPYGDMVDYLPQTSTTGRLTGICSVCERTCNRMTSKRELPEIETVLDVAYREGRQA